MACRERTISRLKCWHTLLHPKKKNKNIIPIGLQSCQDDAVHHLSLRSLLSAGDTLTWKPDNDISRKKVVRNSFLLHFYLLLPFSPRTLWATWKVSSTRETMLRWEMSRGPKKDEHMRQLVSFSSYLFSLSCQFHYQSTKMGICQEG